MTKPMKTIAELKDAREAAEAALYESNKATRIVGSITGQAWVRYEADCAAYHKAREELAAAEAEMQS